MNISGFPQKPKNRIPWLFHDWFASFHDSHSHMVSDMVMIVFHDMHDNHKLESCYSHENKQFHDFSTTFWEIFTFQDFFMTAIFSRIFHDRGNPDICAMEHKIFLIDLPSTIWYWCKQLFKWKFHTVFDITLCAWPKVNLGIDVQLLAHGRCTLQDASMPLQATFKPSQVCLHGEFSGLRQLIWKGLKTKPKDFYFLAIPDSVLKPAGWKWKYSTLYMRVVTEWRVTSWVLYCFVSASLDQQKRSNSWWGIHCCSSGFMGYSYFEIFGEDCSICESSRTCMGQGCS